MHPLPRGKSIDMLILYYITIYINGQKSLCFVIYAVPTYCQIRLGSLLLNSRKLRVLVKTKTRVYESRLV